MLTRAMFDVAFHAVVGRWEFVDEARQCGIRYMNEISFPLSRLPGYCLQDLLGRWS